MPLPITYKRRCRRKSNNLAGDQELHMFDGKNNRLLDSFSFRVALTVVGFALWSGAGYALLSLL
jgi:hypothetical protein